MEKKQKFGEKKSGKEALRQSFKPEDQYKSQDLDYEESDVIYRDCLV
ncbi:MAG: hypothetical protein PWP31_1993 [Clostridia bacterium]|nr:hypothetical protein [Clostridia bacterium]